MTLNDTCPYCALLTLELDALHTRIEEVEASWKGGLLNEIVRVELWLARLEGQRVCPCPNCAQAEASEPLPLDEPVPLDAPIRLDFWRRKHG